ncbi:hypothetical protein KsCSTR_43850 [Candidatus Kuenenia stuttgartiensis]|uniref:Uncharacterized protein n=1 Tax=Kuenenia stuttgartiensis TaxID=174633 RepID=A0A6G7GWM9_KUEST|nr:hypothetical protein KsCSTR_43850 [Candidatus Kuenenia stuttgartiensis]
MAIMNKLRFKFEMQRRFISATAFMGRYHFFICSCKKFNIDSFFV